MDTGDVAARVSSARKRSCFIVEDEMLIGMDLEDAIGRAGYDAHWFVSQARALAAVETDPPQVAIVDLRLQDGGCEDLLRTLARRGIPFIIHSAMNAEDAPLDLQAVTWLVKPATPIAVVRALGVAIDGRGRGDAGRSPAPDKNAA